MIPWVLIAVQLGAIGVQALPARGCAAYLWRRDDQALVAMASADPPRLRVRLDRRTIDLARGEAAGAETMGLFATARYAEGDVVASLELHPIADDSLRDGALVPYASLRLASRGGDELVVPLAGMIGCASAPSPGAARPGATK